MIKFTSKEKNITQLLNRLQTISKGLGKEEYIELTMNSRTMLKYKKKIDRVLPVCYVVDDNLKMEEIIWDTIDLDGVIVD